MDKTNDLPEHNIPPGNVTERRGKADDNRNRAGLSTWHEFYVELLGSLVPGLFTVIFGGSAVGFTIWAMHASFYGPFSASAAQETVKEILPALQWVIASAVFVTAYVIGAVFFRQDPKRPDTVSALSVWMRATPTDRAGHAVQPDPKTLPDKFFEGSGKPKLRYRLQAAIAPTSLIKKLRLDAQFPYRHLQCYLKARGLTHLLHLVRWCPKSVESLKGRTKMLINIYKLRVLDLYPKLSRELIRNEAHVRLATSVWYAVSALRAVAAVDLLLLSSLFVRMQLHTSVKSDDGLFSVPINDSLFLPTSVNVLLFALCVAMRGHLRKCIHYMRVREVIYVLEVAHLAHKANNGMFEDIWDGQSQVKCDGCEKNANLSADIPRVDSSSPMSIRLTDG